MAAARKVSAATTIALRPASFSCAASFPRVVVLPPPLTPTTKTIPNITARSRNRLSGINESPKTLCGNTANNAGGINNGGGGTMILNDSTVNGNTAELGGGEEQPGGTNS